MDRLEHYCRKFDDALGGLSKPMMYQATLIAGAIFGGLFLVSFLGGLIAAHPWIGLPVAGASIWWITGERKQYKGNGLSYREAGERDRKLSGWTPGWPKEKPFKLMDEREQDYYNKGMATVADNLPHQLEKK